MLRTIMNSCYEINISTTLQENIAETTCSCTEKEVEADNGRIGKISVRLSLGNQFYLSSHEMQFPS